MTTINPRWKELTVEYYGENTDKPYFYATQKDGTMKATLTGKYEIEGFHK